MYFESGVRKKAITHSNKTMLPPTGQEVRYQRSHPARLKTFIKH